MVYGNISLLYANLLTFDSIFCKQALIATWLSALEALVVKVDENIHP